MFCIGVSVGLGGYYLEEIKVLVRIVGWTREDMVLNWKFNVKDTGAMILW